MPFTTHSSEMKHGEDYERTNTSNTSRNDPSEISKTARPVTSSFISRLAEKPNPGAASGNPMQRWLNQGPKEEPWYHSARLKGDTAQDGNVKK